MAWSIELIREGSEITFFPVDEMAKAFETKCGTAYVGKEAIQHATQSLPESSSSSRSSRFVLSSRKHACEPA
jgi:hypothetical protein